MFVLDLDRARYICRGLSYFLRCRASRSDKKDNRLGGCGGIVMFRGGYCGHTYLYVYDPDGCIYRSGFVGFLCDRVAVTEHKFGG